MQSDCVCRQGWYLHVNSSYISTPALLTALGNALWPRKLQGVGPHSKIFFFSRSVCTQKCMYTPKNPEECLPHALFLLQRTQHPLLCIAAFYSAWHKRRRCSHMGGSQIFSLFLPPIKTNFQRQKEGF